MLTGSTLNIFDRLVPSITVWTAIGAHAFGADKRKRVPCRHAPSRKPASAACGASNTATMNTTSDAHVRAMLEGRGGEHDPVKKLLCCCRLRKTKGLYSMPLGNVKV